MLRGTERSGGGLLWVRRLFCNSGDVSILFFLNEPFDITVDLEARTQDGLAILAEAKIRLRILPLAAAGLKSLLAANPLLSRAGLAAHLRTLATPVLETEAARFQGDSFPFAEVEAKIASSVADGLAHLGLGVASTVFSWGIDDAGFEALDAGMAERQAAAWRFGLEARVSEAERSLDLHQRRIENLTALSRALGEGKSEIFDMLLRASFGREALMTDPPGAETVGKAIEDARAKTQALETELCDLRNESTRAIEAGPPAREPRIHRPETPATPAPEAPGEYVHCSETLGGCDEWLEGGGVDFYDVMPRDPLVAHGQAEVSNGAATPASTGLPLGASALGGWAAPAEGDNGKAEGGETPTLHIGGTGMRQTAVTRCVYCMAPLKPGWKACSNCGREIR